MKMKKFAVVLSMLLCVALIGVGFATWVITGDGLLEQEGNVTVAEVEDRRITVQNVKIDKDIVLAAPSDKTVKDTDWLLFNGEATENLNVTITGEVKVVDKSYLDTSSLASDKITITYTNSSGNLDAAGFKTSYVDAGLLSAPVFTAEWDKITDSTEYDWKEVDGGFTLGFTVTVEFKWGSAFGNVNPYTYYNGILDDIENGDTLAQTKDKAYSNLKALEGLTKFKINLGISSSKN